MTQHSVPLFVGIDAHQESLTIAVLAGADRHPEPVRTIPNRPAKVRALFRRLMERGPVQAVYEAGCLGFVLHRLLGSLGVDCMVCAPSRIPTLPGERRKTDRLDAQRLALYLRGHQLTPVRPPSREVEALRTLVRTRDAMREDVVRAKHRISKLLLLRGHVYRDGGNWSAGHLRWMRDLEMPVEDDRKTLDFLLDELEHRQIGLAMLDERIERRAELPDVAEQVRSLQAFRGVRTLTALAVVAEIGDPRRFRSGKQVAAYCGLVPSEHSSGKKISRGAITRAGNPRLRRLLVECAQHYGRLMRGSKRILARRSQAPPKAQTLARRAERRLKKRYRTVAARKHTNVAKTAVARELVAFLWAAIHPDLQPAP